MVLQTKPETAKTAAGWPKGCQIAVSGRFRIQVPPSLRQKLGTDFLHVANWGCQDPDKEYVFANPQHVTEAYLNELLFSGLRDATCNDASFKHKVLQRTTDWIHDQVRDLKNEALWKQYWDDMGQIAQNSVQAQRHGAPVEYPATTLQKVIEAWGKHCLQCQRLRSDKLIQVLEAATLYWVLPDDTGLSEKGEHHSEMVL